MLAVFGCLKCQVEIERSVTAVSALCPKRSVPPTALMTIEESFLTLPVQTVSIKNAVLRRENTVLRIEYAELCDGGADEQSILDHD